MRSMRFFMLHPKISYPSAKLISVLLFPLFFCAPSFSSGQRLENLCRPEVLHFTPNIYQAQRQNWSIAQHHQTKFMYTANSKGLLEFDGSHWKCYELPRRQIIRSVMVGKDGLIYTGALGEFGYWQRNSQGQLSYHSLVSKIPDKAIQTEEIWHIIETTEGIFFQSFAFLFLLKNHKIEKIEVPSTILYLFEANNKLWIGGIDQGLYELKNKKFVFVKGSEFLKSKNINVILPYQAHEILIGTNAGLFVYDGITFREFNSQLSSFVSDNQLNTALRISPTLFAFGTILNGFVLCDLQGNILQHFHQKNDLQNNTILSFTLDQDANLWVGMDSGIDYVVLNSPIKYFKDPSEKLGMVYCALLDQDLLYLGTNRGLFVRNIALPNDGFRLVPMMQGRVLELKKVDEQIFCGHNSGTFLLEKGWAHKISNVTGGWVLKKLSKHPDVLIQGTYTKLCIYRKKSQTKQWEFSHFVEGFSAPVKHLEEDSEGNIWVNLINRGVSRIQLTADLKSIRNEVNYEDSEFYRSNLVQVNGKIMVATSKGLLEYQNGKFKEADLQKKWKKVIPQQIFPLDNQRILINKLEGGLAIYDQGQIRSLPLKSSQLVDENNIFKIAPSLYFVCVENGFILLPEKSLNLPQLKQTQSLIRELRVENRPIAGEWTSPSALPVVSLGHEQNSFVIKFCTLPTPLEVTYTYVLESDSKRWVYSSVQPSKEFNNLPPGAYTFRLKSNLSTRESLLQIEIRPPWYWNMFSQTVYCILFLSLLYLVYRVQQKRFQQKHEKQKRELEEKLRRQAEENHQKLLELRNQQLEQDVIRKSEELANSAMNIVRKNELLEKVEQELLQLPNDLGKSAYQKLHRLIERNLSSDKDWRVFEANFNQVHEGFLKKLLTQYPNLSKGDLKLAAFLRMNLSSKEIAGFLNITVQSVELKRHRLRQKINLPPDKSLSEFIMQV